MKQPLFHPSLISLDNAAEDFWQEYRRKQGLPVHPSSGKQGVSGSTEGRADEGKARSAKSGSGGSTTPEMAGSRSVTLGRSILRDSVVTCHRGQCGPNRATGYQAPDADSSSLWADSHMRFHFPNQFAAKAEAAKEAQFIQDVELLRKTNQRRHWIDSVPWFWRFAAAGAFLLAVYVYGQMLGAW